MPKSNALIPTHVKNPCYFCTTTYSSATALIKHMKDQHQITLTPRKMSHNRPANLKYKWITKESTSHCLELFGCPSCWYYCPNSYGLIAKHINDYHLDEENNDQEDTPIDPELDEEVLTTQKEDNTIDKLVESFWKLLSTKGTSIDTTKTFNFSI